MAMDEKTRDKLAKAIQSFLHDLLRIADEENYDRDSFVRASADLFDTMATVSTFEHFQLEEQGGKCGINNFL